MGGLLQLYGGPLQSHQSHQIPVKWCVISLWLKLRFYGIRLGMDTAMASACLNLTTAWTRMKTDTKFFTNSDSDSLLARFRDTLAHTQFFDVLVGYFRASGFAALAPSLGEVERIRILVGLTTDSSIFDELTQDAHKSLINSVSHGEIRDNYSKIVQHEMENALELQETENSIALFIKFIQEKRLEIRGHPSHDIHAKVYIMRYHSDQVSTGSLITGSSNFSFSGLTAQREFNVELKDRGDVEFALEKFEALWNEGVNLTEEFVATITHKTWFNNNISPYELYLKFLFEYFKEDINADDGISSMLPEGFADLAYQKQAVTSAIKILNMHDGVFLSDVVGLGKTFISAMILQQLHGQKLIICPPILKEYWEEVLRNFYVHPVKVVSSGKLDDILGSNHSKYQYILVDESHKFRNELTQSYEQLKNICIGKKIILLSATPFNNRLTDLLAQIKLFQPGKRSTIPGVSNLETFFAAQEKELKSFSPGTSEYKEAADKIAARVRDKVLKHIMIRRTRGEVVRYFPEDIKNQGLRFPQVANPIPLSYEFDSVIGNAFQKTIDLLKTIKYSRYTPLLYLKEGPTDQQRHSQNNARGFIKSILVKRLESSFYAFGKTIGRFVDSYAAFIQTFEKGFVYIGKGIDVFDLLDYDDEGELDAILTAKDIEQYTAKDFNDEFLQDLIADENVLKEISNIWHKIDADPKFDIFFENIQSNELIQNQRLLVFTESRETAEYLYQNLETRLPGASMFFSSQQGIYKGKGMPTRDARKFIQKNLDPSEEVRDDFRILVTTDVLSEGMNLHRAGRIMNYDLPWNPTRIMQRVGRINRVGSSHDTLYIFNFFPTEQADAHLGLEANILKKITEFNAVLGNDSKFLYGEETPDPHGLMGRLSVITEDESEDSELQYLQEIRSVRDNEPALFEKIKRLPIKARSAHSESETRDALLVFFREDYLKKFIQIDGSGARELTFLEAAPRIKCSPAAPRRTLPADYYQRLQNAREFLRAQDFVMAEANPRGTQPVKLLDFIRVLQNHSAMTDVEQEYLQNLYEAVQHAALGKKSVAALQRAIKNAKGLVAVLNEFRKIVPPGILESLKQTATHEPSARKPRCIVLAQYLAPGE